MGISLGLDASPVLQPLDRSLPPREKRFATTRWLVLLATCWLITPSAVFGQNVPSAAAPDEIFYDGKIVTVDPSFSIRQAFAVKDDKFLAVGSNAQIRALTGPHTRSLDLYGATVIPGLADAHNHQYNAALVFRGVNLENVHSLAELLDRIRNAVASARPGEAIFATPGWSENSFPEKRAPTLRELDQVSRDHPIFVYRTRLAAYVNSATLRSLGITRDTESFAGAPIQKDSTGGPSGLIAGAKAIQAAVAKISPPLTEADKEDLILKMQQEQHALGLTSIRELELSPEIMRLYCKLRNDGKLTMRISMGLDVAPEEADKMEQILSAWGVNVGFGDHWLRLDSVSEFPMDDQIGLNAHMREPYLEPPGNKVGASRITPELLREATLAMNKYGWRPAIHIYGDKSLDTVLEAYEAADRQESIRDKRWVVEHIPIVHTDQIERMERLGVLVSAQFQPYWEGDTFARFLGHERSDLAVPMRDFLDHHLIVATGSDWPLVTDNPFVPIYFYVTRKTVDGQVVGPSEKINREEALRVSTINEAYMTFEEKIKGSIEAGKLADFVILSQDVLTVPEDEIRLIHPLATYVGGQKVFSSKEGTF